MASFGISQLNISGQLALAMAQSQRQLAQAQIEVSTGRHADMGLSLGGNIADDLQWRAELAGLQQISDGNKLAQTRATLTQDSMKSLSDAAASFIATLTGARGAQNGQVLAKQAAETAYEQFTSILNTSENGQYIFGGINSGQSPLSSYAGSLAESAVSAAFQTSFGMAQNDPAAVAITPAAMQVFIDTNFADQFQPPQWLANWSPASGTLQTTRVDKTQTVEAATSAAMAPFRQLAQAFIMVSQLGTPGLSQATFQAVVDKAMATTGGAQAQLAAEQSRIGLAQAAISAATDTLDRHMTALTGYIQSAESVDKYEAATRTNALMTQLETSYTLTGRISQLSLLKYI